MKIKSIWYEFDSWAGGYDESDENFDVRFELEDGTCWCATFYTYKNLISLSEKNKATGELLEGQYFCAGKPVFISRVDKELIEAVLEDILKDAADPEEYFTRANNG